MSDIGPVVDLLNRCARPLTGQDETTSESLRLEWQSPGFDLPNDALWFLALDDNQIADVSLCWPRAYDDPDLAWVGHLAVRRPWRRRGIAYALLLHSFRELWQHGKRRVGLGVDTANLTGALRLYEKAGMHASRQYDLYEKELRPGQDPLTPST